MFCVSDVLVEILHCCPINNIIWTYGLYTLPLILVSSGLPWLSGGLGEKSSGKTGATGTNKFNRICVLFLGFFFFFSEFSRVHRSKLRPNNHHRLSVSPTLSTVSCSIHVSFCHRRQTCLSTTVL